MKSQWCIGGVKPGVVKEMGDVPRSGCATL